MTVATAMKRRLFAAIELPAELIETYRRYGRSAADSWPAARWTDPNNLHLTVCFFGDVEESAASGLIAALDRVALATEPFMIEHQAIVLAPPGRRPPTMIWSVFGGGRDYDRLARATRAAAASFAPEMPAAKEFIPHATLARFRRGAAPPGGRSLDQLEPPPQPFRTAGIGLFASRLSPSGPVHTVIERLNFNKPN